MRLDYLILYSGLLEFWDIFETIYLISPLDQNGYFTFSLAGDYLTDKKIDFMTHQEFWFAVKYCLNRVNHSVFMKRKQKNLSKGDKYVR